MKVIKIAVDGVQLRIEQISDKIALVDAGQYGRFAITHRVTTHEMVERMRERRYFKHLCMECGRIMETPNVLGTCGSCE